MVLECLFLVQTTLLLIQVPAKGPGKEADNAKYLGLCHMGDLTGVHGPATYVVGHLGSERKSLSVSPSFFYYSAF